MSDPEPLSAAQFDAVEEAMAQTDLGRQFLDEYARRAGTVGSAQVVDALSELRQSLAGEASSGHMAILRRELQEMSASITKTRSEIAAIKHEDAGDSRIMAATGELDVIVSATERATSDILTSAEHLQEIAAALRAAGVVPEQCDEIEAQVVNIFTACTFQDITGQRTTKVVNALRYLEQRVNAMIEIWGIRDIDPATALAEPADARPDAAQLHGPQAEGEGASQDDIDRILQDMLAGPDGASSDADKIPAGT